MPLLIAFVVTTAVRLPSDGWVLKVTINWVAVALVTVPVPLLKVTRLLPAMVSNPVPAMVRVMALIARLLVFEVTVGATDATTVAVCPVKAMLFKSTLALADEKFAVMRSSLPSLLISPKLTEDGLVPTAKSVLVAKVPLPLPKSMLALLEPEFAVMMSSLPSPLISPKLTDLGLVPTAKSVLAAKVPSPLPKSTLTLLELKFAVMISSLPSPFTSPKVTDLGLVPLAKSV